MRQYEVTTQYFVPELCVRAPDNISHEQAEDIIRKFWRYLQQHNHEELEDYYFKDGYWYIEGEHIKEEKSDIEGIEDYHLMIEFLKYLDFYGLECWEVIK